MEINIDVEKFDIKDGQTIIVKMPVPPGMHFHEIQDHLGSVAKEFKTEFDRTGKKIEMFIFPINPNGASPSIQIIPKLDPGNTIIMHVPVGDIEIKEIPRYLKTVKDTFLLSWDEKYPGINLEVFGVLKNGQKVELRTK